MRQPPSHIKLIGSALLIFPVPGIIAVACIHHRLPPIDLTRNPEVPLLEHSIFQRGGGLGNTPTSRPKYQDDEFVIAAQKIVEETGRDNFFLYVQLIQYLSVVVDNRAKYNSLLDLGEGPAIPVTDELRDYIKNWYPAFRLIRSAIKIGNAEYPPIEPDAAHPIIPNYLALMSLLKALRIQGAIFSADGEHEKVLDVYRLAFSTLGYYLSPEMTLNGALVYQSQERINCEVLTLYMMKNKLDEILLAEWARLIAPLEENIEPLHYAYTSPRDFIQEYLTSEIEYVKQAPNPMIESMDKMLRRDSLIQPYLPFGRVRLIRELLLIKEEYAILTEELAQWALIPPENARSFSEIDRIIQDKEGKRKSLYWQAMTPNLLSFDEGRRRTYSSRRQLMITIALKRHQLRHGAYPVSLDGIDKDLLYPIPLDPYSGAAFEYENLGDHFRLKSADRTN